MSRLPTLPSRTEVITAHRASGGQVAAVWPVHHDRALLRAHGVLPVEVWGPPGADPTGGDAHLQAYTCSIIRRSLGFLLSGGLEVADHLLVPHACDSLQGLGSVLQGFIQPRQPVHTLYLPRSRGEAAVRYLADELRALGAALVAHGATAPTDAALHDAITREELSDALAARLLAERPALSNAKLYALLRAREYVPAEVWSPVAREALAHGDDRPDGVPVVLSGVVPEPRNLLSALDDAGAVVVGDDTLCVGRRLYPASGRPDPYERMAHRLLHAPPDITTGASLVDRAAHITRLVERTKARAVVFWEVKSCEPEQFGLPHLRAALDTAGVPSVVLEVDVGAPLPHQALTRVEALLEVAE